MLKMSCPNCKGVVNSPFLADVLTIECEQCKEDIPVEDVFITTPYFTINRTDFLNRTFRFQRLLGEVEKDLLLLAKDKTASLKSIENLEQFHTSLHELLDGARDSYRIKMPRDLYVEVNDENGNIRGKLLNLSTEGCSIEFVMFNQVPRKKAELGIEFFFPELSEHIYTHAKVMWLNERVKDNGSQYAIIGVTFVDMDKNTRRCLWNFIIENVASPFQWVSK